MNTQSTCPRCDKRINEQWKVCGYCGYRLCNADHCTPEERAVIEAAIAFHTNGPITEGSEYAALVEAIDTLLAARAGREKEK